MWGKKEDVKLIEKLMILKIQRRASAELYGDNRENRESQAENVI